MNTIQVEMKKVKKLIYLLITFVFFSCDNHVENNHPPRKCTLTVINGSGWTSGSSKVECDSFQMQGTRKVIVWVDGYKMNIESEGVIYPTIK